MRASLFAVALLAGLAWAMGCSDDETAGPPATGATSAGGMATGGASGGGTGGAGAGSGAAGGGGGIPIPDGVVIRFPPARSITDEASVTVHGTALLAGDIDSLSVAGTPATSIDGFTHWAADVPLSLGNQTLSVDVVVDGALQTNVASVETDRRGAIMVDPTLLAFDGANGRVFAAAGRAGALVVIWEIDLTTAAQRVVSSNTVGSGDDFDELIALAWDPTGQRILAMGEWDMWSVDPVTGARAIVKSRPAGPGPWPTDGNHMVVDVAANRLIATTANRRAWILAIDLTSFALTPLAKDNTDGPAIGVGPDLDDPRGIELDVANGRVIVVDDGSIGNWLVAVDLATGDRTVLSGVGNIGTGPQAALPDAVAYHDGTAWVSSSPIPDMFEVDLATGHRTRFSDGTTGSGPLALRVTDIHHDGTGLVATDQLLDAIVRFDTSTEARSLVSSPAIGAGPDLLGPNGMGWDAAGSRLLVLDQYLAGLVAIDPLDGSRTVISSATLGIGAGDQVASATDVEAIGGSAYVPIGGGALRIDLSSGDGEVVTSASVGSGPDITTPGGIAANGLAPTLLWVAQPGAVLSIVPTTGVRAIVSDGTTGTGPEIAGPGDIVYDAAGDRLLVADHLAVLEVDPVSGDRTELSGLNVGDGPLLNGPRSAYLAGSSLYVCLGGGYVHVDLDTGDRTTLSEYVDPGPITFIQHGARDDGGRLFASDAFLGAIFAIDSVSGERVIFSK